MLQLLKAKQLTTNCQRLQVLNQIFCILMINVFIINTLLLVIIIIILGNKMPTAEQRPFQAICNYVIQFQTRLSYMTKFHNIVPLSLFRFFLQYPSIYWFPFHQLFVQLLPLYFDKWSAHHYFLQIIFHVISILHVPPLFDSISILFSSSPFLLYTRIFFPCFSVLFALQFVYHFSHLYSCFQSIYHCQQNALIKCFALQPYRQNFDIIFLFFQMHSLNKIAIIFS